MNKIKWINMGMSLQKNHGRLGKTAEIYCGDEDYARFLIDAFGQLGIEGDFDTYTIDGEYFVEVRV